MSVVSVNELKGRREGGEREDGTRWYRRVYSVITDTKHDGSKTVCAASGIPQRWYTYATESEQHLDAIVTELEAEQVSKAGVHWEVTVEYDTRRQTSRLTSTENSSSQ